MQIDLLGEVGSMPHQLRVGAYDKMVRYGLQEYCAVITFFGTHPMETISREGQAARSDERALTHVNASTAERCRPLYHRNLLAIGSGPALSKEECKSV